MKELDVLLEQFLNSRYDKLKPEQEQAFLRLMQMEDPDLMATLMGKQPAPDDECANVIELLKNVNREI